MSVACRSQDQRGKGDVPNESSVDVGRSHESEDRNEGGGEHDQRPEKLEANSEPAKRQKMSKLQKSESRGVTLLPSVDGYGWQEAGVIAVKSSLVVRRETRLEKARSETSQQLLCDLEGRKEGRKREIDTAPAGRTLG